MSKHIEPRTPICSVLTIFLLGWTLAAQAWAAEKAVVPATWDFALIGDVPYEKKSVEEEFPHLIEDLNQAQVEFVVHDGDIKSGSSPCSDSVLEARLAQLQTIAHPLFYVPGDNEWMDCDRVQAGAMDPMERLQKLRSLFCQGPASLGQKTLPLMRQSDPDLKGTADFGPFSENIRWTHRGVILAGVNVPGSDNHVGHPEYVERNKANMAWISGTFAQAKKSGNLGVVLVMQANPHFELPATHASRKGFNEMLELIQKEAVTWAKPVLLVHGDSHYFRIDKPLIHPVTHRRMEHFTRLETFGNPDVHWIRVMVDPSDPNLFQYRIQIVEKNRAGR